MFVKAELGDIVNNAPEKPGIYYFHCLKHVAGCIECSKIQLPLIQLQVLTTFPEKMLNSRSFITIAYDQQLHHQKISCISHQPGIEITVRSSQNVNYFQQLAKQNAPHFYKTVNQKISSLSKKILTLLLITILKTCIFL